MRRSILANLALALLLPVLSAPAVALPYYPWCSIYFDRSDARHATMHPRSSAWRPSAASADYA